jgi:hypothetical protein
MGGISLKNTVPWVDMPLERDYALPPKGIRNLKQPVIDAWILVRHVVIRDMVIAVLGADGAGMGAIEFEPSTKVESEVKGIGLRDGDGPRGVHTAAVTDEEWLCLMVR